MSDAEHDCVADFYATVEKARGRGLIPRGGSSRAFARNRGAMRRIAAVGVRASLLNDKIKNPTGLRGRALSALNTRASGAAERRARVGAYLNSRRAGGGRNKGKSYRAGIYKAKAKTLYVFRPVENAADILAWAQSQGFGSTLAASDLHVTVAFSKTPLNWAKLGDDWCAEDPRPNESRDAARYSEAVSWSEGGNKQRRIEGGAREVKALGDKGAVVLAFQSPSLTERWAQFVRIGASWDYAGFTPHITISFKASGVDLSKVEPYKGVIILGEEDWNEIEEGAGENVPEVVNKAALDALNARLAAVEAATAKPAEAA